MISCSGVKVFMDMIVGLLEKMITGCKVEQVEREFFAKKRRLFGGKLVLWGLYSYWEYTTEVLRMKTMRFNVYAISSFVNIRYFSIFLSCM
jgi:hypothetical protein